MSVAPYRGVDFAPPEFELEERSDGTLLLRSALPLAEGPPHLGHVLRHWAAATPERTFLAERINGGWRRCSYAEARQAVDALSQALLDRGLGAKRPLAILSGNSIEHGLLAQAAMQVGVPVVPVSVAYSQAGDREKLRHIIALVEPGLIYCDVGVAFADALRGLADIDAGLVYGTAPPPDRPGENIADLLATVPGAEFEVAFQRTGPEDVAKILFTSGSTGMPKGVITPHRMLTSNQMAWRDVHRYLADHPPILVDWLPWNHCYGGSYNFNVVLVNGGTLYIDHGKPMPGQFDETVACLRDVAPTLYLNVPAGYEMLLPYLERDMEFARHFFSRMDAMFYAGSALPEPLWRRMEDVAVAAVGERMIMTTAYGATETGPLHTMALAPAPAPGHVGLPVPGAEVLLLPADDHYELRCGGPNVTPGYFRDDERNRAAFDDEGFLITGDAVRFATPGNLADGLIFEGRIANNFKLLSGTWVQTDEVRVGAIAHAPIIHDALVAGHDRADVGLLIFPDIEECRRLCAGLPADTSIAKLVSDDRVRDALRDGIAGYNERYPYRSRRIGRALILMEPPEIYEAELTDKRSINQREGLRKRDASVEQLYAEVPDADAILFD